LPAPERAAEPDDLASSGPASTSARCGPRHCRRCCSPARSTVSAGVFAEVRGDGSGGAGVHGHLGERRAREQVYSLRPAGSRVVRSRRRHAEGPMPAAAGRGW
jgi:hypothetical protein